MLRPPRVLSSAAPLLVAAVMGGGVALAGAELTGLLDDDPETVEIPVAGEARTPAAFANDRRLSINAIYRNAAPGVVQITTTTTVQSIEPDPFLNPFGFPEERRQQALGSGFVIDTAGHIVTNYHVVENAEEIEVSFTNRDSVEARVLGRDPSTDIAVLKVDVDARALRPLGLGSSAGVRVGDSVVAIGNPLGFERSVTSGIVSAVRRPLTAPNDFTIDDVIQTDAAINSGNSGGPLLGANGRVIGVNTAIATGNTGARGNIGIGFAIPIDLVKTVVSQLIEEGRVEHPFIGVGAQEIDEEIAQVFNLPVERGLLVVRVYEGSGAQRAGLRQGSTEVVVAGQSYLLGGDIIVAIDGRPVSSTQDLRQRVAGKKVGDKVEVEAYRDGEERSFDVTLARQPANASGER